MPSSQLSSANGVAMSTDAYYVVTPASGKGFVIVSTDDRMPLILGYSTTSAFDADMPEHVRWFLSSYQHSYELMLSDTDDAADRFPMSAVAATVDSVGPLLGNIHFDQGAPFNRRCPGNGNSRCLTGCVATAMAQVMRYYQYPRVGTGSFTFTPASTGTQMTVDLQKLPFRWDLIKDDYTTYTEEEGNAVAELMLAAGAAAGVTYDFDGTSGNYDKACQALSNNFNYTNARYLRATGDIRPFDDWMRTIVSEHNSRRPVMFAGAPSTDGHAFVVDGYKTSVPGISDDTYYDDVVEKDVLYHINWGWSGNFDGWFYIGHFKPSDDYDNFSGYRWEMIYRIAPGSGTDIEQLGNTPSGNSTIYNLLGLPVSKQQLLKGHIYIQDGKKFVF